MTLRSGRLTAVMGKIVGAALVLDLLIVAPIVPQPVLAVATSGDNAHVRLNRVGYLTGDPKVAVLMASGSEAGATFSLIRAADHAVVYTAPLGVARGRWNDAFPVTYALDFSAVTAPGIYSIQVHGPINTVSPSFRIGSGADLYGPLLPNARFFYQAQRDGSQVDPRVMDRQPSHLADRQASIYRTPHYDSNDVLQGTLVKIGGPIDVSGGWFDAGDYIKLVETASYADAVMLLAVRQYPGLRGDAANFQAEGAYGLDWLNKMWDEHTQTLYYQVGIGDGNGNTILGDHDFFRLPQADDALNVHPGDPAYFVKYRPVFQSGPAGSPISPNLAGRLAADFALCYQIYRAANPGYAAGCLRSAETIFDLAQTTNVLHLLSTAPHDYYPESEWRDDMELGAAELYFATALGGLPAGLPHSDPGFYLQRAAHWANAYIHGPNDGGDSLNLYDVSGLAHYELYHALVQAGSPGNLEVSKGDLLGDLHNQLTIAINQAADDPFRLGAVYGQTDATPHALGLALEASFYDELAGVRTYSGFATAERDWVLGANAWGSSFVVGAGSLFPHCMQHQVANLSGSLDGTPPIVLGATVDGPSAVGNFSGLGLQDGMRACPTNGVDLFSAYTGKGARFADNVAYWPSVEPADDYTALTILLFARLAQ